MSSAPRETPSLVVGYLVNQYPKISHSFIRREILTVEAQGVTVHRVSVRRTPASDLVDRQDQVEREKTHVLLSGRGVTRLLAAGCRAILSRPGRFWRTVRLALRCGWRSDRGVAVHLAYVMEACLLREWLAEHGCTHLHAHFGTNPAMVAMLCRELGGPPYSFTGHGTDIALAPRGHCLGEKIARAAFVAAVSRFGRSQMFLHCDPGHWDRIHLIRCGIDESFFVTERGEAPPSRFVAIGRLSAEKGHTILLEAVHQLSDSGVPISVALIGDGPLRPELERRIARSGLGDRVELAGWATPEQIRSHLQRAIALVLPSFSEGLPVVVMEALAVGCPVIASNVGGVSELVIPGETGWLVAPGDVEELAAAMVRVVSQSEQIRAAMGRRGRELIRARHDCAQEAGKLIKLFRDASTRRISRRNATEHAVDQNPLASSCTTSE